MSHSRNGKGTGTEQPCLEATEWRSPYPPLPSASHSLVPAFPQSWGCEGALPLWACLLPGNRKAGNYWRFGACGWGCKEAVWGASGKQAVCHHSFYPVSPWGSPENYRFWFQANGHKTEQRRLQLLKNNSQNIKKNAYDTAVYTVYISLLAYKTIRLNGRFYLTKISLIACVNGISRYLLLEHIWNCLCFYWGFVSGTSMTTMHLYLYS